MNKAELVKAMAEKTGLSEKKAGEALNAFEDVVSAELKGGRSVQIIGFGTFLVSQRAARTGKNPQTGESIEIAASKAPKFKPGKRLKDFVN